MLRPRTNAGLIGLLAAVCLSFFPGGALLATNDNNPGIKKVVFEVGELTCGAGANILTLSVKATKDGKSVPVSADHGTVSGETFSISREDIIESGGGGRKCHVTFTAESQTRTVGVDLDDCPCTACTSGSCLAGTNPTVTLKSFDLEIPFKSGEYNGTSQALSVKQEDVDGKNAGTGARRSND